MREVPFTTVKFLGATVRNFSSSIGLSGQQPSSITINLVEDADDGDNFVVPEVGSPVYFQFYQFRFFGLLQSWRKLRSTSDYPTFQVTVQDPREILDACQLILAKYTGSVLNTRNMLNPFGYWENALGFGGSLRTEAGMPWFKIASAVQAITSLPAVGFHGGPLGYHGYNYRVDLSRIPAPPLTYRIPQDSASLLDVIGYVLEDAGCDFYVTLSGLTIVIWPISRLIQPPLGTITSISENIGRGDVIRSEAGMEARNEPTTTFLTGGEVQDLFLTETIRTFWGFNILGQPILGIPTTLVFPITDENNVAIPGQNQIVVQTEQMDLNSAAVADITGTTFYKCTTFEMRLALIGISTWLTYIAKWRPIVNHVLLIDGGIGQVVRNEVQGEGRILGGDQLVNDDRDGVLNNLGQFANLRADFAQRLHNLVRSAALDYMGKKFVVDIPDVLYSSDPDTGVLRYSHEISDGGYLPEGASPLGINIGNEDLLTHPDGRYTAFVRFNDPNLSFDLSRFSPDQVVTEQNIDGSIDYYIKVSVDQNILQVPDSAAIITLPSAIHERPPDQFGGIQLICAYNNLPENRVQEMLRTRGGFGKFDPIWIAPDVVMPDQAAIPLKSNILVYGPWYLQGQVGKVRYEQNTDLTPWNYGGYANMNSAAYASLASSATNMQISETGTIELAGTPLTSLGGVLMAGGPNVTNLDVSFGENGVSTTYRFNTFTPRFGVFGKGLSERIKKLGVTSHLLRREFRRNVRQVAETNEVLSDATRGCLANYRNWDLVHPNSPYTVLVAQSVQDGDTVRQGIATQTLVEATMATNADDEDRYQSTAIMSWDGLLRPIDMSNAEYGVSQNMSFMGSINDSVDGTAINAETYNPWKNSGTGIAPLGHSFEIYSWGDTYNGLKAFIRQKDDTTTSKISQSAKIIGLRGPLMISGWGYDVNGVFQPAGEPDYLLKPDTWKSGPVDLIYDHRRKVWTSHDILRGIVDTEVTARSGTTDGTGVVRIQYINTGGTLTNTDWYLTVYNMFASVIASTTYVLLSYDVYSKRFYVAAAEC